MLGLNFTPSAQVGKKVASVGTCARFLAPVTIFSDPQGLDDPNLSAVFPNTPVTFPTPAQLGTTTLTTGPISQAPARTR